MSDLAQDILDLLEKKPMAPHEIVDKVGYSRQYVSRVLDNLSDQGEVVAKGSTSDRKYALATPGNIKKFHEESLLQKISKRYQNQDLSEHTVFRNLVQDNTILDGIQENVATIYEYSFTEMLNNAIDHSQSEFVTVRMERLRDKLRFEVIDKGVGIFSNIKIKKNLDSRLAAAQDLLKGKETTMPAAHSGEGIFFTSRVADKLVIESGKYKLEFNNNVGDIFLSAIKPINGTKVTFEIAIDSSKVLKEMFSKYTDDNFEFDKTEVFIRLYEIDNSYISRSQAKRLLSNLDKFKRVVFDFEGIDTIGQGFADEIFRVWAQSHPGVEIEYRNAHEVVEFFIKRAIKQRK